MKDSPKDICMKTVLGALWKSQRPMMANELNRDFDFSSIDQGFPRDFPDHQRQLVNLELGMAAAVEEGYAEFTRDAVCRKVLQLTAKGEDLCRG